MGYHVSITRERDGVETPIALPEWLEHVARADDLELEKGGDASRQFLVANHAARWRGGSDAWLLWSNGEIWTKNPSEELLRYMIAIAPRFNARVRGDEGEFYLENGDSYVEQGDREVPWAEAEAARIAVVKKRRRRKNTIKIVLLVVAVAIAVLKAIRD